MAFHSCRAASAGASVACGTVSKRADLKDLSSCEEETKKHEFKKKLMGRTIKKPVCKPEAGELSMVMSGVRHAAGVCMARTCSERSWSRLASCRKKWLRG